MAEVQKDSGRMLGTGEGYFAYLIEEFGYGILYQVGVLDSSHELSVNDVRKAGRILASHQEALRMKIVKSDKLPGYKFEALDNWEDIDVKIAYIDSKDDWGRIIEEETGHDFINTPLWGITLAEVAKTDSNNISEGQLQYVIMLKLHHAISDAKSAFDTLYRQFLPILSAVVNKGDPEAVLSEIIPLQACYEEAIGAKPLPWYMKILINLVIWYKTMFCKNIPYSFVYKNEEDSINNKSQSSNGYFPVVLSSELTTDIIKAAKRHKVSVHSALTGVASVALCATSSDAGVKLENKVNLQWTIDVRKYLGVDSPQPLCLRACVGDTTTNNSFNHSQEEFWQMCEDIYQGIKSQNNIDKCASAYSMVEYLIEKNNGDWKSFGKILIEHILESIAVLSNIGDCNNGPEPELTRGEVEFKLQEVYFAGKGSRDINAIPIYIAISTFDGKLMMNFQYSVKAVSTRFINNLSLKFMEVAQKYCTP